MVRYKVTMPFLHDMGSLDPFIVRNYPMESAREAALFVINSARDHDGLPRLNSIPKGTKFERID